MRSARRLGVLVAILFVSGCVTTPRAPVEVPERWDFQFDSRQWVLGNQDTAGPQAIREYVLDGETVEDWSELVTLSQGCPSLKIAVIEETPDSILFEWRDAGCQGYAAQHELRRSARAKLGNLSLAYVEKTPQLSPEKRDTWIAILKDATIRPGF